MKKLIILLSALSIMLALQAESPEKISYQAIIRNTKGELVKNQAIGMKVSILQTSATGTVVYAETHTPTTNINGLVTILIGAGNVVSGTFSGINWSAGPYFIKTEIDPDGGTAYSITSTSELLSVPYALYAKNTGSIPDNSVNSAKIADGSVGTADMAPNSVTSPKIADGTINTADIADGAVTVAKLPAGATATTYLRGDGTWITPAGGGGTPGGSNGNVQFNNNGTFAGTNELLWNETDKRLEISVNNSTLPALKIVGGGLFCSSTYANPAGPPPVVTSGSTLMWWGRAGAFRAGIESNNSWDTVGFGSFAAGVGSNASGECTTALGYYSYAPSWGEVAIGNKCTMYTPDSPTDWDPDDRIFVIGNGTKNGPRSDAMSVYKSGVAKFWDDVNVVGKITVQDGKGIIRSSDNTQRKMVVTTVTVNTSISGGATTNISFNFDENFTALPAVYVGDATGGGFAEVVMTLANVTNTGAKLFVFNPKSGSQSPNFTVKIVAVGKE